MKLKKICFGVVAATIVFANVNVFAADNYELTASFTEEYAKWKTFTKSEKELLVNPRISTVNIPEHDSYQKKSTNPISVRNQIFATGMEKNPREFLVGNKGYEYSKYDLRDHIQVNIKNQEDTNECWAFSMTNVLETNVALTKNISKKFSPRHMDYSLMRRYTDGVDENNFARTPGIGGLAQFAVAYLTNGKGAVLESEMPFQNNENLISKSELIKPVDTIATDTVTFPALYKEYNSDGSVVYTNGGERNSRIVYSKAEVEEYRNEIKNHIVEYGAISAVTAGNQIEYYNNPSDPLNSTAYFCNDSDVIRDHAVTIIGWDDNYSKENFTGRAKPSTNGAYICLNSYGNSFFENGCIYISYEDSLIETYLYGIKSSSTVDYDNIYQYNPTGTDTSVGISSTNEGYIAEFFERDNTVNETLKYIGIDIPVEMSLEIYVNPTGANPLIDACTRVAKTNKLSAGYHRIPINEINLTGTQFTIMIKTTSDKYFEFSIEVPVDNTMYSGISGNPGKSIFSLDGHSWQTLSSQYISGLGSLINADMTIKAFTINGNTSIPDTPTQPDTPTDEDEPIEIGSEIYIIKDEDIYNISYNTTVQTFKQSIYTNSETIEVIDGDRKLNDNEILKTGDKIKLSNNKIYTAIVKGDINCDGRISLVDVSKLVGHYGDENKYGLTGNPLKAADLNIDGRISLIDISQAVNYLGNI